MDFLTLWSLLGFLFAVYAVTANDSIQTLGTYISSNRDIKWYWMFGYMGSIFLFTMIQGFSINDPAFGRLDKFEPITIQWYHALAPLVLVALTRLKIPVSTTFLVLSVFATSIVMEQMLVKSFVGYAVSFVFACGSWYLISKYFLQFLMKSLFAKIRSNNLSLWIDKEILGYRTNHIILSGLIFKAF